MIIPDEEVADLKTWIVKKLEPISDADSDVLADYVLALIRADAPDEVLRPNATENLEDFLRDNTLDFVNELFHAIHAKAFQTGYVPPPASSSTSPILPIPSSTTIGTISPTSPNGAFQTSLQSRKRSYNEASEPSQGYDPHYSNGDRNMKQIRRGGRGNFNGNQPPGFPNGPAQLPGLPGQAPNMAFNPNDALAAMMTMQAMGMPMPPLPGAGSPPAASGPGMLPGGKNRINARCRDYDTKGFCLRGIACPFNHGDNSMIVPGQSEEYDPKTPTMTEFPKFPNGHNPMQDFRGRGQTRGRGFSDRGGQRRNTRADFSQLGPNHDRSITSIVVEQIPEENFEEAQVRQFFSDFGTIDEVTMKPYKRLALVKFDNYQAAKAAYDSPRVIFDNRFVKVYWYKPDAASSPTENGHSAAKAGSPTSTAVAKPEEPAFDKEKFQRDAEAAQKKLEERKAQAQQNNAKLAEIEKKQAELKKKREEELARIKAKLADKGITTQGETTDVEKRKDEQNEKKQSAAQGILARLEAEAISMGVDPNTDVPERGRGRGYFRGRGRGSHRGFDPSRASFRGGRGAYRGAVRAGGAYNLDNRPKKVKVEGVHFDDAKDEALKQYLFTVGEFTSIEPDPAKNAQIIAFKDRPTAEQFFYGLRDIPGLGKVELSWVSTPLPPVSMPSTSLSKDGDMLMGGTNPDDAGGGGGEKDMNGGGGAEDRHGRQRELDYDVAEEEDWIA